MAGASREGFVGLARLTATSCLCGIALGIAAGARADGDDLASALYVRNDSDRTLVVSPRVRAGKRLGDSTVGDVTYTADVWTSASVDVRASASVRPVTEQRDELDVSVTQELADLTLTGAYRFSIEHDYDSHGGTLAADYRLADNAATLAASVHGFADTVGRAGDPAFGESLGTIDVRLSFTQIIDPEMLAQATYELAHSDGFLSSPYRWVGAGGTGFGCEDASSCLPERLPEQRTRHALAALLRRALSKATSVGVDYRFYFDDWGLTSHTVLADLGWSASDALLIALRYRFYRQGAADFYQARYATLQPQTLRTRDRELSKLTMQRAAVELEHDLGLRDDGTELGVVLSAAGNFYTYDDFVGLTDVSALEVSAALTLRL